MNSTPYMLTTLYKSSGKKIQTWTITAWKNNNGTAYSEVTHGQIDGKMQTTRVQYTEGKNIGRSNETTPFEQCLSECKSKWNKQKDKGYTEDPSGKSTFGIPHVMRAHTYRDYKHKIIFPSKIQPKFDGMRCLAVKSNDKVKLWSRGHKPIETAPHIQENLNKIMNNGEVFDGELYVHDLALQLQISLFKKFDKDNYQSLTYRVYDMVSNENYDKRYFIISERINNNGIVELAPTYTVNSHEEIIDWHNKFVEQGFEGAILRVGECFYHQNKKSTTLLKVKEFMDDEFEIVGAKENIGKDAGTCTFICKVKDGVTFDARLKGSRSIQRQCWEDFKQGKLMGKMLTVRFFEWTVSDNPKPKHGVGIAIRDYE